MKILLAAVTLFFNDRARLVGINQIQSNFMPHLSVETGYFIQLVTNQAGLICTVAFVPALGEHHHPDLH